jgi:hypothetical protein
VTAEESIALAWSKLAPDLAKWALDRVFVRTDRYGGYYIEDEKSQKCAKPPKGPRPAVVGTELLVRHFRARCTDDVIGSYQLTAGGTSNGRAAMADIDAHADDKTADPNRNEKYAKHLYFNLVGDLGFHPLLATWGGGSYHLYALFDRDVPGELLHSFGRWLVSDAAAFGFSKAVESFPKQPAVPEGKYGNWLRLVGRHHTHNVWASVFDGNEWLEGERAVEHILSLSGDSPDRIPAGARPGVKPAPQPSTNGTHSRYDDHKDAFEEYNRKCAMADVCSWHESHGHAVTHRSNEKVTFTRGGKDGGESFNVKLIGGVPITYNFSPNSGMPDHQGLSPSQMRCFYERGSCDKPVMAKFADVIRAELGWETPRRNGKRAKPSTNGTAEAPAGDGEAELKYTESGYTVLADGSTWRHTRDWDKEAGKYIITKRTKLANFNAAIVGATISDDGAEQTHELAIRVSRGKQPNRTARVTSSQFASLSWVIEKCGHSYVISAGNGNHDHLRCAIQEMSNVDTPTTVVYRHTGWREFDGKWRYLHASRPGTVGSVGMIPIADEVQLTGPAAGFWLPPAPTGQELRRAVKASLSILDGLAPDEIAFPLLASVYRAALGSPDYALWLCGMTGVHKSELAALAQQHFGSGMVRGKLPGNWSSTDNALEGLAFTVKDSILVIDDYAPSASRADADRQRRSAERIIRGQGNGSGRQRMKSDGTTLRPERPSRCLLLSTGEDEPGGHSITARLCVVDVARGDVNLTRLSACQKDAVEGLYATAIAGFTAWLAPRYGEVSAGLAAERIEHRSRFIGKFPHARTPDKVANLLLGLEYLLRFAEHVGAITAAERECLELRGEAAFVAVANREKDRHNALDPVARFPVMLSSIITSGRAHIADRDGKEPQNPEHWGYERRDMRWEARGKKIGWLDGEVLYIDPDAVYAELTRLSSEQGQVFPVSAQTLWKRLKEAKKLYRTKKERTTYPVTIEGSRRQLIVLRTSFVQKPSQPSQPTQKADSSEEFVPF